MVVIAAVRLSMRVVARHPGGLAYTGRLATADIPERLARMPEGAFTSVTLDGMEVAGG